MKNALVVLNWFVGAILVLALLFVVGARFYHSRRFRACSEELEAAVRSGKTFESFAHDSRPDGLMRRYSPGERGELLGHVVTRTHTAKDAADVDAMAERAHTSAVFHLSDMVYVLFFDREDRLREFVCLSN